MLHTFMRKIPLVLLLLILCTSGLLSQVKEKSPKELALEINEAITPENGKKDIFELMEYYGTIRSTRSFEYLKSLNDILWTLDRLNVLYGGSKCKSVLDPGTIETLRLRITDQIAEIQNGMIIDIQEESTQNEDQIIAEIRSMKDADEKIDSIRVNFDQIKEKKDYGYINFTSELVGLLDTIKADDFKEKERKTKYDSLKQAINEHIVLLKEKRKQDALKIEEVMDVKVAQKDLNDLLGYYDTIAKPPTEKDMEALKEINRSINKMCLLYGGSNYKGVINLESLKELRTKIDKQLVTFSSEKATNELKAIMSNGNNTIITKEQIEKIVNANKQVFKRFDCPVAISEIGRAEETSSGIAIVAGSQDWEQAIIEGTASFMMERAKQSFTLSFFNRMYRRKLSDKESSRKLSDEESSFGKYFPNTKEYFEGLANEGLSSLQSAPDCDVLKEVLRKDLLVCLRKVYKEIVDARINDMVIKGDSLAIKGDSLLIEGNNLSINDKSRETKCDTLIIKGDALVIKCESLVVKRNSLAIKGDSLLIEGNNLSIKCDSLIINSKKLVIKGNSLIIKSDSLNVKGEKLDQIVNETWPIVEVMIEFVDGKSLGVALHKVVNEIEDPALKGWLDMISYLLEIDFHSYPAKDRSQILTLAVLRYADNNGLEELHHADVFFDPKNQQELCSILNQIVETSDKINSEIKANRIDPERFCELAIDLSGELLKLLTCESGIKLFEEIDGDSDNLVTALKTLQSYAEDVSIMLSSLKGKEYSRFVRQLIVLNRKVNLKPKGGDGDQESNGKNNIMDKELLQAIEALAAFAEIRNEKEAQAVFEKYALPETSFLAKRHTLRNEIKYSGCYINGYLGVVGAIEYIRNPETDTEYHYGTVGLSAPVGLEFTLHLHDYWNFGLLFAPVDLGTFFQHKYGSDREEASDQDWKFSSVYAPGVFLTYAIPEFAVSVAAGYQIIPNYRRVDEETDVDVRRACLIVAMDIPIFRLY